MIPYFCCILGKILQNLSSVAVVIGTLRVNKKTHTIISEYDQEIPQSQTADKPMSPRLAKSGKGHNHQMQTNPCHPDWLSLEMTQSQTADQPMSPRLAKSGNATFTNCRQTHVTASG